MSSSAPFTWTTAGNCYINATFQINQWSANINLLTNFTEYAYNTSTSTTTDTTSFGYGPTGCYVQAFAPVGSATINKRVRFTQPIKATDLLILEFNYGGLWFNIVNTGQNVGSSYSGSLFYYGAGISVTTYINSTDIDVIFNAKADDGTTAWSYYAQGGTLPTMWRVRKVSNGNFAQGSPSYSQTIGDGSTLSYTITHNLGTQDIAVAVWELTGNLRQVTSGVEVRNTSATQCTLVFAAGNAPATNALRVEVFSSGGTQAAGDRLAPIANAEVVISTTANASIRKWHNCTATGANYTVTLPQASLYSGQFIGIRIDPSSTYVVTIAGYGGTDLIDGVNTRIMWAGESCELKSNGVSWNKVGGRTIPMSSSLGVAGNQTFAANVLTALTFTTNLFNDAPPAMQTAASSKITIIRPGKYHLLAYGLTSATNTTACDAGLYVYVNGANTNIDSYAYSAPSLNCTLMISQYKTFTAGTYFTPYGYYTAGSFTTTFLINDNAGNNNAMILTEIPTW